VLPSQLTVNDEFGTMFSDDNPAPYNLFVEPQWSVADEGPVSPEWQVSAGFNVQFLK
jgi:hypothetical protein